MTTYEQPKDWIERHLVEDPGGLLACEPSGLNEELKLARQANEFQHQQLAGANKTLKDHGEIQQALCSQLAEREKQVAMLRSYLNRWAFTQSEDECAHMEVQEALAATADLDGLILCHAEPVAFIEKITSRLAPPEDNHYKRFWMCYEPLYRAGEPKTRKVKMECFLIDGELYWRDENLSVLSHWIRQPHRDIVVEVPE